MITKITKDNLDLYGALFQKAEKLLNVPIKDLNSYYANLKTLIDTAENDPDATPDSFLILPLDEPALEINANTREIVVPSTISDYGIGVEGDSSAEIVFFVIDRYFDMMDLSHQKIYIEWEKANGEKGLSTPVIRDIESDPTKVAFGWALTSNIMNGAGRLRFAVRFYTYDPDTKEVIYSLRTLPAAVKINSALDFANSFDPENNYILNDGSKTFGDIKNMISNSTVTDQLLDPPDFVLEEGRGGASVVRYFKKEEIANLGKTEYRGYSDILNGGIQVNGKSVLWVYGVNTNNFDFTFNWYKIADGQYSAITEGVGTKFLSAYDLGLELAEVKANIAQQIGGGYGSWFDANGNILTNAQIATLADPVMNHNIYRKVGYLEIDADNSTDSIYKVFLGAIDANKIESSGYTNPAMVFYFLKPREIEKINDEDVKEVIIPSSRFTPVTTDAKLETNCSIKPVEVLPAEWAQANLQVFNSDADAAETIVYKWYKGNALINDETQSSYLLNKQSLGDAAGTYKVSCVNIRNGIESSEKTASYIVRYTPNAPTEVTFVQGVEVGVNVTLENDEDERDYLDRVEVTCITVKGDKYSNTISLMDTSNEKIAEMKATGIVTCKFTGISDIVASVEAIVVDQSGGVSAVCSSATQVV